MINLFSLDILIFIFYYLNNKDLLILSSINKYLNEIINNNNYKIWEKKFIQIISKYYNIDNLYLAYDIQNYKILCQHNINLCINFDNKKFNGI